MLLYFHNIYEKKIDIMEIICKICGEKVFHEKEPYCISKMLKHLKFAHSLTKEEYLIKYELNGEIPRCACGCGNPVSTMKGWNKWRKYYKNHKNHMKNSEKTRKKISDKAKERLCNGYYDSIMREDDINNSFDDFYYGRLTLTEIQKKYNHDKRTIKRIWISKKKINEHDYEIIAYRNNFTLGNDKRFKKYNENLKYYEEIYEFIIKNKYKYNICEINRIFGEKMNQTTLLKHLIKLFGDEVVSYLVYGVKSKEEIDFLNILKFYFGGNNIKYGFRLNDKIYDALLFGKILIEYDGEYFHKTEKQKENDKIKNNIAIQNNYILIRCTSKSIKDINLLNKINDLWKNIK